MIRLATREDLDRMMDIYAIARQFMRETGNPNQWNNNKPTREDVERDIEKSYSHVLEEDGEIHGVFVLQYDRDSTYDYIEGAWRNEEPYGAIHRVASDGTVKGFFTTCADFAKERYENLKIDTHEDNKVMQHVLEKNGFKHCGTIYLESGESRLAYHYVK